MAGTLPFKGEAAMFFQFQSHLDLRCRDLALMPLFSKDEYVVLLGKNDRYSNFFQTFSTYLKLIWSLVCSVCLVSSLLRLVLVLARRRDPKLALWHLCSLHFAHHVRCHPQLVLRSHHRMIATTLWFPVDRMKCTRFEIIRFLAVW